MHALEKLIVYYNQCKDNDIYKSVIENLLKNLDQVKSANIYDMAELCYASPTTISRLSRKMGYEGFTDFKTSLVNCVKNYYNYNRFVPQSHRGTGEAMRTSYFQLLRQLVDTAERDLDMEQITRINDRLSKCRKVCFYTCGIDFIERHFQELLIVQGKSCVVRTLPEAQMEDVKTLDEDCTVIYIIPETSESGDAGDVLNAVKDVGAHLVMMTDTKHHVYRKLADELIWFDGVMSMLDDYYFAMILAVMAMDYRERYVNEFT